MKPLCIYHGNCMDGFAAAWAVWKAFGMGLGEGSTVDFHPGVYGEAPPPVKKRDVIIVDFSYKRDVLAKMAEQARTLLVIDHHKTALEDLEEYVEAHLMQMPYATFLEAAATGARKPRAIFSMTRSGAGLTWEYFHPGKAAPPLIQYVEDFDIQLNNMAHTRAINAAIRATPYDLAAWEGLHWDLLDAAKVRRFIAGGEMIDRKLKKDVDELVALLKRRMTIGGVSVPVCNLPHVFATEAGNKMAADKSNGSEAFAACYWDTATHRVFSLRSEKPDGMDVAAIAAKYGGGGHKHAAGFRVALGKLGELA